MEITLVEISSGEKHTNMKKKKRILSFFRRVQKALKHPFLCSWNKVEPCISRSQLIDPEPLPFLIRDQSSAFESISLSSTVENTSKTTLSLSEDSKEREGKRVDRTSSLEIVNIYSEEMNDIDEMPVNVPSVTLGAQSTTDVCSVGSSATEEPTNRKNRIGFLMRLWTTYLLLCCIRLPDSVDISLFQL